MEKLLYGVAYYDEYMPYERLDKDIEMMKAAGINVVRIGESTWSTMEPQPGVYDTSHLTRVIEAMGKAGISVIIGTPTYAIPTWMAKAHPEILETTNAGKELYGRRQNMDITHPAYRYYAERIIRKMMETCAQYENVIGVQLDNETKAYGTAGPNVQHGFVKYLREKFDDSLDTLNAAFGLDYWSNRINAWEDVPDVRGTINGSLGAEFQRYQRMIAAEFLMWQRSIVEPYLRPEQFITHNTDFDWRGYSYGINGEVDVYEDAFATTVLGVDIYHPSQAKLTGMEIAFGGDVTRSVKQSNYLVLETEAQGFPEWLPYDGQLRLQAFSHLASGAEMVEYWHWHSLHNAVETYWKGLLSHDFRENDTYRAAKQIGSEFEKLSSKLVGLKKKNRVAVLVSNTALTAIDWFPISGQNGVPYKYNDVLMELYRLLYENNIECDILFPQNAEEQLQRYDLVIVPALYAAPRDLLEALDQYTEKGGNLFVTYKSAFADENNRVYAADVPYTLSRTCGVRYSHFTIPDGVEVRSHRYGLFCEAQHFMELLIPDGKTEVLASYAHPAYARYAAATRLAYGKGNATYVGCGLNDDMMNAVLLETAEKAGLKLSENRFPVIERTGRNREGRQIVYLMNYSPEPRTAKCCWNAVNLLTEKAVLQNTEIQLSPWDLAILECNN
ncbi:MAG: beta-galactosidase [Clostridia bacterium]|nr:beta-galactosidase [Clostridia bacterium]